MSASSLCRLLVLLATIVHVGACVPQFTLNVGAGHCLNPPDHFCDEEGTNSRVLEVRVYQLKTPVNPDKLDWTEFLKPGEADLDLLKGVLTDPDNPEVRTVFTLQARDERSEYLLRLKGTRYLLVVTVGRHQGEHSIDLIPLTRCQREERLYFEYYDVSFRRRDDILFRIDQVEEN